MRTNLSDVVMDGCLINNANRFGIAVQTLTGTTTLQADGPQVLFLDPGGSARTVKLWASPQKGDWVLIYNTADAAEVITVQTSAGVGLTNAITPTQAEAAFLVYDGAAWWGFVALAA